MTKQTVLKITGMHCSGCAGNVEKALRGVKGVTSAVVDLKASKATVEYDSGSTTEKDLSSAVKNAGYGTA